MSSGIDQNDKSEARKIAIAIAVLIALLGIALFLLFPLLSEFNSSYFVEGLGLKSAAIISFFVTTVLMIVLAIAAGDGLLGELQFMVGGFLTFFVVIWLMVAWIF